MSIQIPTKAPSIQTTSGVLANPGFLLVHDTRTSHSYEIPVLDNVVKGSDLARIKGPCTVDEPVSDSRLRLRVFDPGYENVAIMRSSITYADGESGHSTLEFRGHTFQDLARLYDFQGVMYLVIWDRVPSPEESQAFRSGLALASQNVPQSVVDVVKSFSSPTPYFPMIMAALSTFVGEEPAAIPAVMGHNIYAGNMLRVDRAIMRSLAAYSVALALVHCRQTGIAFTSADPNGSYISNLFLMMGICDPRTGKPDPQVIASVEKLWIQGVDHELNNSTSALLHAASTLADPISCVISAISSSYGVLHFGAAESGYKTMQRIGTPDKVAAAIAEQKKGGNRLMGIGHRVYKTRDPRIELVKSILAELKAKGREDPLVAVAFEIERQVNADPYFVERRLCANVDLYWQLVYTALDIPIEAVLPMFIASRMVGFMAHWHEAMAQPVKMWRPNQIFTGKRAKEDLPPKLECKL